LQRGIVGFVGFLNVTIAKIFPSTPTITATLIKRKQNNSRSREEDDNIPFRFYNKPEMKVEIQLIWHI